MKTDNYDQRVRITKIMIRDAYIKLLAEKDIQHITVRELCETAHINRGTFYSHYIDIYDLKDQVENELLNDLSKTISETLSKADKLTDSNIFLTTFELMKNNSDLCIIILSNSTNMGVVYKFTEMGKKIYIQYYKQYFPKASEEKLERYYSFIAAGCIAILREWMLGGMKTSLEELAKELSEITSKGITYLNHS